MVYENFFFSIILVGKFDFFAIIFKWQKYVVGFVLYENVKINVCLAFAHDYTPKTTIIFTKSFVLKLIS